MFPRLNSSDFETSRILALKTGVAGYLTAILALIVLASTALASLPAKTHRTSSLQEITQLTVGEKVSRSLNGKGQHLYSLTVEAGNCIRLRIEQKGIDVMIALRTEDGRILKRTDRPSGSYGTESVTFVSQESTAVIIEIAAFVPDALNGGYVIEVAGAGKPMPEDMLRSRAEDLTSLGEEMRSKPTVEEKVKGIATFKEALQIWEGLGDRYEQAIVLYGIGFSQYSLSENYQAAVSLHKALSLARSVNWLFGQAVVHTSLGSVQYTMGQYDFSEFNFRRAIKIYSEMQNVGGQGVAYHGLGTVQILAGKYSDALKSLEFSMNKRVEANSRTGMVLTGLSLVELRLLQSNPESADFELRRVGTVLGVARSEVNSQFLYFRGRVQSALGVQDSAAESLHRALQMFEKEGNRLRKAQTNFELGRVRFLQGRYDEALAEVERATDSVEELRSATVNFRQRVGFTSLVQPMFEEEIKILMALDAKKPGAGYARKAFNVSERARSRGLLDSLERRMLIRRSVIDVQLLEEETRLLDRIGESLRDRASSKDGVGFEELQDLLAEYADIEVRINGQLNVPENAVANPLSLERVESILQDDTVLLSYVKAGSRLYLWTVTGQGTKSFDLGPYKVITSEAESGFKCISEKPSASTKNNCEGNSSRLGSLLLGEITNFIVGKKVIVARTGDLEAIPWSFLKNPTNGKYLVETNEITVLPSASILGMLRVEPGTRVSGAAVFADPVYSEDDGRLSRRAQPKTVAAEDALPRLFASRFEALLIKSLLSDGRVSMNLDFDASRERFVSTDLKSFRILHFAAHAVIDDESPELSAIIFSRFNDDGRPRDGKVRLNDIQRLDLDAELVVLSACRTGAGKQVSGEGFQSLARAFFSAGARNVMFTGWPVDDRAAAELMSRFYKTLASGNLKPAEALREAQRSLLKDRRWAHPYYWAAFAIQGGQ